MNFLKSLFKPEKKQAKVTQIDAIKILLLSRPNQWIPMPVISEYTKQRCDEQSFVIHSRIAELRDRGWIIENKMPRENGKTSSYYRLIVEGK
jgi:hypothetical protein